MQKIDIKVNKSKIYFTPLFNEEVPISYFKLLKNTYFWYDDYGEETFCLLYKFNGTVKGSFGSRSGFTVYEHTILMSSPLYKGHRDYGEYVIFQFNLTDKLLEYRDILLEGKYSKFPQEMKDIILKFNLKMYGPNEKEHLKKILYKDKSLIKELAEKYNEPEADFPEATSKIIPSNEMFANFLEIREEKNEIKKV